MLAFTVLGVDWYIALAVILVLAFIAVLVATGALGVAVGRRPRDRR